MDNVFTSRDIALLAHKAAIEEIAEIQQRMALRELIGHKHEGRALPLRSFLRSSEPRQQTLKRAPERVLAEDESDRKRLAKLYAIVERLEEAFAKFHDASDEAWAEGLNAYFRDIFGKRG